MTDTTGRSRSRNHTPSGRFVLRIDPDLHAALREAAREGGISLNEYCIGRLVAPAGVVPGPAAEVVKRAVARFGDGLEGVVLFGSWAREEAGEASDVDVLAVVGEEVPVVRGLYRQWDEGGSLEWDGHEVEVHFAHLPVPGARVSGLWAEVSVDGVVLFERDLTVSRRLVEIRQRIVSGEVGRRRAYGQTYWVEGGPN